MSTIRRVYFYAVSIITLGIFASGLQILLSLAMNPIRGAGAVRVESAGFVQQQLSLGLALLIIGGLLWFFFWRAVQKQVSGSSVETGSAIRKLFLNFILVVAGLVSLYNTVEFLNWLLAGASAAGFPSGGLGTLIVAAGIWLYHWRVSEKEGHPSPAAKTLKRWYLYILTAWSLIAFTVSLVQFLTNSILHLPFWGGTVVSVDFWNTSLQGNIGWVIAGGASWAFHWFRAAREDTDSTLRQVYLYLLTILGGAIAGLAALTTTLQGLLRAALGSLEISTGSHFQFLGWSVPAMLVAAAVWGYHRQVVREEAAELPGREFSARRVLLYLMSFIGLGAAIAGLIMFFGLILELLTNALGNQGLIAASPGWWRQQLSLSVSLLLVGVPLWIYYWQKVRILVEEGVAELRARSRRVFLYVVVGVAIITLAADLVNIVYQLLNGILQGRAGLDFFQDLQWSLQTLVIAIPVLFYHWRVLRQGRGEEEEKLPESKTVTLLAGESGAELAKRLEAVLGERVRLLRQLGQDAGQLPAITDEELQKVVNDIQSAPGDRVLLVITGGKLLVIPYQEQ